MREHPYSAMPPLHHPPLPPLPSASASCHPWWQAADHNNSSSSSSKGEGTKSLRLISRAQRSLVPDFFMLSGKTSGDDDHAAAAAADDDEKRNKNKKKDHVTEERDFNEIGQAEIYKIISSQMAVPSKWRKDRGFIKLLYAMTLRGEIPADSSLMLVVDFTNYMTGACPQTGAVLFKCSLCSYMGDRYYHTKKHFQRVHVMNGKAMHRKRKFDFDISKEDLPYVHSPWFNRKIPIVRETLARKKKKKQQKQQHLVENKQQDENEQRDEDEEEEDEEQEYYRIKDVDDEDWHVDCEKKCKKLLATTGKRTGKKNDEKQQQRKKKTLPKYPSPARTDGGGGDGEQQLPLDDSSSGTTGQVKMAFVGDIYEGARQWNEIGARLFVARKNVRRSREQPMKESQKRRGVFIRVVDKISSPCPLQCPLEEEEVEEHDDLMNASFSSPSNNNVEHTDDERLQKQQQGGNNDDDAGEEDNELFFQEAWDPQYQEEEELHVMGGGDQDCFFSLFSDV